MATVNKYQGGKQLYREIIIGISDTGLQSKKDAIKQILKIMSLLFVH